MTFHMSPARRAYPSESLDRVRKDLQDVVDVIISMVSRHLHQYAAVGRFELSSDGGQDIARL